MPFQLLWVTHVLIRLIDSAEVNGTTSETLLVVPPVTNRIL
jgi:hypothetical protein